MEAPPEVFEDSEVAAYGRRRRADGSFFAVIGGYFCGESTTVETADMKALEVRGDSVPSNSPAVLW